MTGDWYDLHEQMISLKMQVLEYRSLERVQMFK